MGFTETKTVKLKITSHTKLFLPTLDIYRNALSFYVSTLNENWELFFGLKSNFVVPAAEKLTHATTKNPNPKLSFDKDFYKFPSYLRRACIMEAFGIMSSHKSRLLNWETKRLEKQSKNKKFFDHPPKLPDLHKTFPVFYKKEMFKDRQEEKEKGSVNIKLFVDNDWKWITIGYDTQNLKNGQSERFNNGFAPQNPSLIQKRNKFFLHIPYSKEKSKLNSTSIENQISIGVDLGLTNSAVCSAVKSDGTVIGRLFINQPVEKDRLKTELNKLSKAKRLTGIADMPRHWRRINGLQDFIVQNTADQIIQFAIANDATHIVFEHLGTMKPPKGFYGAKRLRFKLQFWAKMRIQRKVMEKAHSALIRYSKVLARGTSMYAYDGSGLVERSPRKDLCIFANNKSYNADLSASYNIAARYFIREHLKPLSEKRRLQVEAKVPFLVDRTRHTLSSLIRLHEVLSTTATLRAAPIHGKEAPSIAC
jgi:putative transposase